MGENIIKIMLVKCVPDEMVTFMAMCIFGRLDYFQQVRKLIMRQLHGELTGMPEGETTQPLYNFEKAEQDSNEREDEDTKAEDDVSKLEHEYWTAVFKKGKGGQRGESKDGKGKGKGYGECWHCGVQGHPSRERLFPGQRARPKERTNGKEKGGWEDERKCGGKKSQDLARYAEYSAAWGDGNDQDDGDYRECYNYNIG